MDIVECGSVTALCLKKCGSGQLRKSFTGKHWEPFPDGTPRFVSAVRNPAHRLVSAWNHLVRHHTEAPEPYTDIKKFGPALAFRPWCAWVLKQDPETMNAHFRPQTLELADALQDVDGLIWIGQLERMRQLAKTDLTAWLGWSVSMPNDAPRAYDPWLSFYTPTLLRDVRQVYMNDHRLWLGLIDPGWRVFETTELCDRLRQLVASQSRAQ